MPSAASTPPPTPSEDATPSAPAEASAPLTGAPAAALTPMFRQYDAAKRDNPGAILMFRMGDFYEMFFEDAIVASKALEITLTSRGKGTASNAPMCGVPFHAADSYIARLVQLGHRVAICEQMEDPRTAKGIVRREVVRTVSPGTITDPAALDAGTPVYVAAVNPSQSGVGLALADLSTGEFLVWEGDVSRAREILRGYAPREIVHAEEGNGEALLGSDAAPGALVSQRPSWSFSDHSARRTLMTHFGVATLDGFGLAGKLLAVGAGGSLLAFLQETQKNPLVHIEHPRLIDAASCLVLDHTTRKNLEIVRSLSDGQTKATLLGVLDLTMTSMGSRLLRDWLLRPLVEIEPIASRHDAVAELVDKRSSREALRDRLKPLPDLERLIGRVSIGASGPRDLLAVRRCLEALPYVRDELDALRAPFLVGVSARMTDLSELTSLLARSLADDAPVSAKDGGLVREGFDPDVDRWRAARRDARSTLADLEARERQKTGISNLKVRYNHVFGYYIEVTRSNLPSVPDEYIRKQTIATGERFVTPELKEFEETLLRAETELVDREVLLFKEIFASVSAASSEIRRSARALAETDLIACFAEAAELYGYVRPTMTPEPSLQIVAGRHPVVERLSGLERFIPNDIAMDACSAQVSILTGPNMGGKSTYLRQTALIVLMAQAGSFVPAESATIGIADRIFCRVGASDNLAEGQSTFLLEMSETANILHTATSRSLVLLDEIGRGTSTFDGVSIAWAVAEWLHDNPAARPRTLFATHYHELTELVLTLPRVRNLHISAREYRDTVLFLRKVEAGPADRSYGIQVAKLAGIPREVIVRAREVLGNLERNEFGRDGVPSLARRQGASGSQAQLPLFVPASDPVGEPILGEIRGLDPDRLTPFEALERIVRWKKALD